MTAQQIRAEIENNPRASYMSESQIAYEVKTRLENIARKTKTTKYLQCTIIHRDYTVDCPWGEYVFTRGLWQGQTANTIIGISDRSTIKKAKESIKKVWEAKNRELAVSLLELEKAGCV